jgi:H+/Cl- antiporter ClcA
MPHLFRPGDAARTCPRCTLPADGSCQWCGHDPADPEAVASLDRRRAHLLTLRRDRSARRAWLAENGHRPFLSCPACRQRTEAGLCEHCHFDTTDAVAVAAHRAAAEVRQATRRERWAILRDRLAPPTRRQTAAGRTAATAPAPVRFMTCPSCHQWSTAPRCEWCAFDTSDSDAMHHLVEEQLFARRRWTVRRHRAYSAVRGLLRVDVGEQARLVAHLVRWVVLGAVVGVLAGLASAGFLESLAWATRTREAHPWLVLGLPLAGFAVGLAYHYGGGSSSEGNNLIIDEIHDPQAWVPRRMAPMVFLGTVVTHLFGGSAGREGTAIQMSGSLTDGFSRAARLVGVDRRMLLIAAMAGGFGSVFGVPIAGCVFGLEVQAVGRIRHDAIVPALTASVIGDLVVAGLGVHHTPVPVVGHVELTALLLLKVLVAGLAFGAAALLFAELTHGIRNVFRTTFRWSPVRPLVGGLAVVGLTYAVGTQDYLGLSLPLVTKSLAGGAGVVAMAFALKLLFTSVTLGSGFQGGEVTPLFVIGATLGATLGHVLGAPVPLLAAIGFVAVFAGATNTPLACTIMGVELFGAAPIVLLAIACAASYVVTGERGIYGTQRVDTPKAAPSADAHPDVVTLHAVAQRRRLWLPAPARRLGDDEVAG